LIAERMVGDFYRTGGQPSAGLREEAEGPGDESLTMTRSEWAYARHREKAGMYSLVNSVLNLVLSLAKEEREEWAALEEFERKSREFEREKEKEDDGPEM
jgi:hypothetical protein